MSIATLQPKVSVVLRKTVSRKAVSSGTPTSERFQGASATMDLTDWLGDGGSVTVAKSVREPSGMFSVVLADKVHPAQLDTLYGLIEPMDVVEIRMAHDPSKYGGADLPIMMRGFVTEISREEVMTPTGPSRSVSVRGQDYGKILQIMQIAYLPNAVLGQYLLTYFRFFENYAPDMDTTKPAADFIKDLNSNVILKFLADMRAAGGNSSPVLDIQVDASVTDGVVAPFGAVQSFEGSVYDMMCKYGDVGPWNELFVEDRSDGVYLVYRPTPFKTASGGMIQGGKAPAVVSITDKEVVSLTATRSDAGVYNYYWVDPLNFNLNTPGYLQLEAAQDPKSVYIADYPNSNVKLYGFRRLQTATLQGPRADGKVENEHTKVSGDVLKWATDRRKVLTDNNKDNVIFETGGMRLQGNESIKAGMTVSLTRGSESSPSEYYAVAVQHIFEPFRSYSTLVSYERGTGFIKRIQDNGSSAYFAEMNVGGLYAK